MSVFYDLNKTPRNILSQAIVRAIVAESNGAWFDPSDLSTLYQDAAGTTPVTAVEQPVGKMLDKSGNGYHATQSITASRPTLSARYNLLTKTEDFSDAVWTKSGVLFTSGLLTDNTTSGAHQARQVINVITGTTYYLYARVKYNGRNIKIRLRDFAGSGKEAYVSYNLQTGSVGISGGTTWVASNITITDIGGGFYDVAFSTIVDTSASVGFDLMLINGVYSDSYTGDGVSGAYLWCAQISQFKTQYQRVNTTTDYDTDPRYFPKYLRFDGVDDYLNLPFMGLYANGSASVVASLIKSPGSADTYAVGEGNSSDADTRYGLVRLSTSGVSASSFIRADDATTLLSSSGTSISTINPNVVSVLDNSTSVRYKSAAADTTESYVRSATLTVNTTTIGALASTAIVGYSRMNLYGLIITKSALTNSQRVACERYLGRKSGVQL